MKANLFLLAAGILFLALAAYGQQQKRIAIVNTVDDEEPPVKSSELNYLTDRLREIAIGTLPQENYAVMTQQSMALFWVRKKAWLKNAKSRKAALPNSAGK